MPDASPKTHSKLDLAAAAANATKIPICQLQGRENYRQWSTLMEVYFKSANSWDEVEKCPQVDPETNFFFFAILTNAHNAADNVRGTLLAGDGDPVATWKIAKETYGKSTPSSQLHWIQQLIQGKYGLRTTSFDKYGGTINELCKNMLNLGRNSSPPMKIQMSSLMQLPLTVFSLLCHNSSRMFVQVGSKRKRKLRWRM
jgi:hypothetical protein